MWEETETINRHHTHHVAMHKLGSDSNHFKGWTVATSYQTTKVVITPFPEVLL